METLFNLLLKRPPLEQSPENPDLDLMQDSDLQKDLLASSGASDARDKAKTRARSYIASAAFIGSPDKIAHADEVQAFAKELQAMRGAGAVTAQKVKAAISKQFGAAAGQVVNRARFKADLSQLRDSIVAIKYLPEAHFRPIHALTDTLRHLEVVTSVAADGAFPADTAALDWALTRPLMLPDFIKLKSLIAEKKRQEEAERDKRAKRIKELLQEFKDVQAAIAELERLDGAKLLQSPSVASAGIDAPAVPAREGILNESLIASAALFDEVSKVRKILEVGHGAAGKGDGEGDGDKGVRSGASPTASLSVGAVPVSADAILAVGRQRTTIAGRSEFRPLGLSDIGFRVAPVALRQLSKTTLAVLERYDLSITEMALDKVVLVLEEKQRALSGTLDDLGGAPVQHSFKRIGNAMITVKSAMITDWSSFSIGGNLDYFIPVPLIPDGRIPHSHGEIEPAGVADLLVVKQQLIGYEAVDVAHIENVLKGEGKVRDHRRRRETEEFTFTETEVTTTEERSLESTDRFEMSRETSQTIKEQSELKAGLSVTAKYGPFVEVSANVEGSVSRSKEEAVKAASTFSKEVTQTSANKITERILQRESLRVTTEVEEKNTHTLDNTGGDGHVSGVYQWVEKIYEAQMFNYGLRMMYDFMVPEPAAYLIEAMRRSHTASLEIEKPVTFTLRPNQINETNYHTWVNRYRATDVVPPPERFRTKSHDFNAGNGDDKTDYTHSTQISIDEGYQAIHATVARLYNRWKDSAVLDVAIGDRTHRFGDGDSWVWSASLDDERDSVPFAMKTWRVSDFAIAVEVKTRRTEHAMDRWRADTHAKLTTAYQARLAEYEEKLAALEAQAGIEIEGKSPRLNMQLMRDEFKKACITILTEQHFDLFDAIENGVDGMPQIDLFQNEAEGPYVRFFEQAFEWEQMTWITYPYYWGRKSEWMARISYEDADPMFNDFLRAGYARVSVPVREGFEGAVDHFVTFGEVWMGGPLPTISSPLFLPIADEIAERLGRPGDEVPEGDPWVVRLPTSLVKLRDDDKLPTWAKDANGNWVAQ